MNNNETLQKGREFVGDVRRSFLNLNPRNVYNTDQSSFANEIHFGRTLEIIGSKQIAGNVLAKNAITHSHTIQPTISMDGNILPKTLLVLREPTGISDRVQQRMLRPDNLEIVWTKSGKIINI